jgi:pimeloyl-ACP methyl ester carboxylesterase
MTASQFLKSEAGERYPDVAADPACRALCEQTLTAMVQGTRCAGFDNDFAVFTGEDILAPGGLVHTPTLIIHDASDPMAPQDHVWWLVARYPQCEVIPVHAAGHLIWVGPGADAMHKARVRFLREHARREAEPPTSPDGGRPAPSSTGSC